MRPGVAHTVPAVALLLCAACRAGGVRPYLAPFPEAVVDTLRADPDDLIRETAELVVAERFRIRAVSPEEGYLDTDWYDLATQRPGGAYAADPSRVIRLRFFADPVGEGRAQIISEAVHRRALDPSLPPRETEVMVPHGHPGDEILQRILDALRERYGG